MDDDNKLNQFSNIGFQKHLTSLKEIELVSKMKFESLSLGKVKANVDEAGELAQQYGIRGIPTLIFFKDGEVKSTLVGNQPKAEILKSITDLV